MINSIPYYPVSYTHLDVYKRQPIFPPGFTCPAVLWIQMAVQAFRVQDSHLLRLDFPFHSTKPLQYRILSKPRKYYYSRFGLFRVRSPLLTESQLISLPVSYTHLTILKTQNSRRSP